MNIGFIGLGVMGFPMAGHLNNSKHSVAVFNRSSNKVEKMDQRLWGQGIQEHRGYCSIFRCNNIMHNKRWRC